MSQHQERNRYTLTVTQALTAEDGTVQVLEWAIVDTQTPSPAHEHWGTPVARADGTSYPLAQELVRLANTGSRFVVVGRRALP